MDLSEIKEDNYIFLKTNGLIDNPSIYKIKQFKENKMNEEIEEIRKI